MDEHAFLPYDILIVEDNPEIADISARWLERMRLHSRHAPDGRTGMQMLEAQKPDLLVLDLNLPEVDGWHVLEYAKKLYGDAMFKVIVMTANDDSANRLVGKLQTVEHYLIKPINRERLQQAVAQVLGLEA